ncbi:Crp/FNR family transcriptional regulator [Sphingobium sp. TKS]|nr:Crp/FNR family transcriptional regulator [Sphingobium sp. TKS]
MLAARLARDKTGMIQLVQSCADCAVRSSAVCKGVSDADLATFHRIGRRSRVSRGQGLIWAGDPHPPCGSLVSGMVKITASTIGGREQIVGLLYPGDFIGQPFAPQAEFTFTALTDAQTCIFAQRDFRRLLDMHSCVEQELLRRMAHSLDLARHRMLMLARQSAGERIAGFLLEMEAAIETPLASEGRPNAFELPLSRGQIAEVLGLTIETVSRQLTKLKNRGIIALSGGRSVAIIDRGGLEGLAEAA